MSSGDDKVRFYFCFAGEWVQVNHGWDYINSSKHGVKLPANATHRRFLANAKKTAGIDASVVGDTKLVFLDHGTMTPICDDEDVFAFLELAGQSHRPPSVVVYVDSSMYDECPYEEDEADDQTQPDSQVEGTSEYMSETQQVEEEDVDDVDEPQISGFDDDEEYVFLGPFPDEYVCETGEDAYDESTRTGYPNNHSYGELNDYYDMPQPLPTTETYIEPVDPVRYNRSRIIYEGQIFDTKREMIDQLGKKFIEEHFQYTTKKSSKTRYEAVCKIDRCTWRLTAGSVGELGGLFSVKKLVDRHSCCSTQLNTTHQQANKNILGNMLKEKYGDASRQLRPKDIVADMYQQYGLTLTYHQAWRARCKALVLVRGTHAESFERLPMYLHNLELQNPGTRTQIRTDSNGRFQLCFVALGCAIRNILNNLRPVLIIDAGHLKGPYLGTMFLAVANDGNNNIVPIAFGVGKSETTEEWSWFLYRLRECIGTPEGLVFMSDRAPAISAAISAVFPTNGHALCCRHLEMNAKSADKRIKVYKSTYWKACRAYTEREFDKYMNALRAQVPEAARVMDNARKEKWSNAHFPGIRYDILTSNSAESVNAVSRFARRLPIVGLVEFFRDFQQQWYLVRREKGDQMLNALTPKAEEIIYKRAGLSMSWRVRGIGNDRFEVGQARDHAVVDMENKECTCLEWNKSGLPCGHAIAAARHKGRQDCSYLAWNYFSSQTYRLTYQETIMPAGPPCSWVFPDTPLMPCYPPLITKNRVGRPSNNDRRPSQGEGSIQRRCGRCGAVGHTQGQCSIPAPSSMPSGSQTRGYRYDLNNDLP